jgi:uncharacterized Zn finger protein (UPF0148 family)
VNDRHVVVHCPMCGGPVHEEAPGVFVCVVDHEVTGQELGETAEHRLRQAMWMAIEALDSEATVLRLLSPTSEAEAYARDAEEQSELLRQFARRHAHRDRTR